MPVLCCVGQTLPGILRLVPRTEGSAETFPPLAPQNRPLAQLELCDLEPDGGDHASDFPDSVPMIPTFASSLSGRP